MCGGDRYDLGRPVVAPTIKKDNRRLCGDDPYALGSSRAPTPTGMMGIFVSATDGRAFCDRGDIYHLSGGYTASSPQGEPLSINYTQKREDNILPYNHIIHYSFFIIHFSLFIIRYSFLHL